MAKGWQHKPVWHCTRPEPWLGLLLAGTRSSFCWKKSPRDTWYENKREKSTWEGKKGKLELSKTNDRVREKRWGWGFFWGGAASTENLNLEHIVPVFCVRGALFSWHLAHLQWDDTGLLHLSGWELRRPLRCGGGRLPGKAGPWGPWALKEGRHLLDVFHWGRESVTLNGVAEEEQEKRGGRKMLSGK